MSDRDDVIVPTIQMVDARLARTLINTRQSFK